jgi:hypothetical protein
MSGGEGEREKWRRGRWGVGAGRNAYAPAGGDGDAI